MNSGEDLDTERIHQNTRNLLKANVKNQIIKERLKNKNNDQ